jgi:hypothetical protein
MVLPYWRFALASMASASDNNAARKESLII